MLINAIRGHAAEFGVTAAKGPVKVAELLQCVHAEEAGVPAPAREMLSLLAGQLDAVEARLGVPQFLQKIGLLVGRQLRDLRLD